MGVTKLQWRTKRQQRLADFNYADGVALLAENREGLQQLTGKLEKVASKIGPRISQKKTKVMRVGTKRQDSDQVTVWEQAFEEVGSFVYLCKEI